MSTCRPCPPHPLLARPMLPLRSLRRPWLRPYIQWKHKAAAATHAMYHVTNRRSWPGVDKTMAQNDGTKRWCLPLQPLQCFQHLATSAKAWGLTWKKPPIWLGLLDSLHFARCWSKTKSTRTDCKSYKRKNINTWKNNQILTRIK